MDIEKKRDGDEYVLKITGLIDTFTSPLLEAEFQNIPAGVKFISLDMSGVEYICSAGLAVILAAHKRISSQSGSLKLKSVPDPVLDVLEITGFTKVMNIDYINP